MRQEISVSRPGERAQEKAKFLASAVKRLAEEDVQVDIFALFAHLAPHVIKRDQLNPQLELDQARAQAVVAVTLNLALDVATKGDVQKAANALKKNPIEKIFAIGERTVQELQERVIKVAETAVVNSFRGGSQAKASNRHEYGVCDIATETLLKKWSEGELSDHPMLPPATRAEIKVITDVLDQIEIETALAAKIGWHSLLSSELDLFAMRYFRREKHGVPTPSGGIWKPFLLSLLVRAMGNEWGRAILGGENKKYIIAEQYVIVTPHVLTPFLELVMFSPEDIPERVNQAVGRLTSAEIVPRQIRIDGPRGAMIMGQHKGVFAEKLTESEYTQLLGMCQPLLNEFIAATREFYMKHVKNIDAPTGRELDEFWRTRLFVHGIQEGTASRVALAEALVKEPWKKVPEANTLHEVAKLLKGWDAWPPEHQKAFLKGGDAKRILDGLKNPDHQAEQVIAFWKDLGGVISFGNLDIINTMWIDWSDRQRLITALIECGGRDQLPLLCQAVKSAKWTPESAARVLLDDSPSFSIGVHLYPSALLVMRDQMTPDDWRRVLARLSDVQAGVVAAVWEAMTLQERYTYLEGFNPSTLGCVLRDRSLDEVKAFFAPIIDACVKDEDVAKKFLHWYGGYHPWQYPFLLDTSSQSVRGGLTADQRFRAWINQKTERPGDGVITTKSKHRFQV